MKQLKYIYFKGHEIDQKIYDKFTEETGILINVTVYDNDELVHKVIEEQKDPIADVVIINGAQYIYELTEAGVLQPIDPTYINENVDEGFYGENYVGFTARARAIVYDPTKVDPNDINTYADLADPKYKGEILVRSSTNGYKLALVENLIQVYGVEKTQQ